jgi:hypothetical protein
LATVLGNPQAAALMARKALALGMPDATTRLVSLVEALSPTR